MSWDFAMDDLRDLEMRRELEVGVADPMDSVCDECGRFLEDCLCDLEAA